MAEYIEREALLGSIGLTQLHFVAHGDNKSLYDIINEQPAADVAPVVRCKDCVTHGNCLTEDIFRIARIENPFCCGGKRRSK